MGHPYMKSCDDDDNDNKVEASDYPQIEASEYRQVEASDYPRVEVSEYPEVVSAYT